MQCNNIDEFLWVSVLYCTLLATAQTEKEKMYIKDKMSQDPELAKILHQLETGGMVEDASKTTTVVREHNKKEAAPGAVGAGQVAGSRKVLDLELMSFTQGSHFMANDKCQLPDGSFRKQKKGYEEVHVPALKPKPYGSDEVQVGIDKLPKYVQPAFDGFKSLNRIQSRICKAALESDENLLVCAPTVRTRFKHSNDFLKIRI